MTFDLGEAIEVLSVTPDTLRSLLGRLSANWTGAAGSAGEWQVYDVVGHLIHGEQTDWIPRARLILEHGVERTFVPFNRFAQFEQSDGKPLSELLDAFAAARSQSIKTLIDWNLTIEQLDLRGMHPELGEVTLRQLLATWVVHDLNHIRQIVSVMAGKYREDVGPWREYLSIIK